MLDDRSVTSSMVRTAGRGSWDQGWNQVGWAAAKRGADDAFTAPARAAHLDRLPPTYLDVGSADALLDETVAFAARIWSSAGRAELHVWEGGFHGFDLAVPTASLAVRARRQRTEWLSSRLQ